MPMTRQVTQEKKIFPKPQIPFFSTNPKGCRTPEKPANRFIFRVRFRS